MKIHRGIFQGDAPSPLLLIIAMMPLNHIRKCTTRYKLSKSQEKSTTEWMISNCLQKNEKELETHAVRIYIQDIGMRHASNEKQQMTLDRRNETTKSRKKTRILGEKETYSFFLSFFLSSSTFFPFISFLY